jgi:hypothetical protein
MATTRGFGAREPLEAFLRARELCAEIGRPPHLVPVIWGLWQVREIRYELDLAEELAREMRRLGEEENNETLIFLASHMSGNDHYWWGNYLRSREYFEEGLSHPTAAIGAENPKVGSLMWLAASCHVLGHLDTARVHYDEGFRESRQSNPFSLALALLLGALLPLYARDADKLHSSTAELLALAREHGFIFFEAIGSILHGWSVAARGEPGDGIAEIVAGETAQQRSSGVSSVDGAALLADAYGLAGLPATGLRLLAESRHTPNWHGPLPRTFIHQVSARLHLAAGDSAAAESELRQAVALARAQSAKFLELGAAIDLTRLWSAQGKRAEARDLLAPVYDWFTEGLDTPVLEEAKALLDELGGAPALIV